MLPSLVQCERVLAFFLWAADKKSEEEKKKNFCLSKPQGCRDDLWFAGVISFPLITEIQGFSKDERTQNADKEVLAYHQLQFLCKSVFN